MFTNIIKYGGVRPLTPEWGAISADLYTEISDALAGSVTPTQAPTTAAQEADTLLAKAANGRPSRRPLGTAR